MTPLSAPSAGATALSALTALNVLKYMDRFIAAAVLPLILATFSLSDTQGGRVRGAEFTVSGVSVVASIAFTLTGAGHVWPGAGEIPSRSISGRRRADANEEMWALRRGCPTPLR